MSAALQAEPRNLEAQLQRAEAHRLGMHIFLDLVPGHTSVEHAWFKQSCQPGRNEYTFLNLSLKRADSVIPLILVCINFASESAPNQIHNKKSFPD